MPVGELAFLAVRNPTKTQIGEWLRDAREAAREKAAPNDKADFAQAGIAIRLGVREQAVRMWEKGRTSPPAHQFLELVWLYGADLSALLPKKGREVTVMDAPMAPHPSTRSAAVSEGKTKRPA